MIDLHTHSTFSDGSLTPEALAGAACRAGLSAIALTDHDSIGGVARLLDACAREGVRGVPGVEIGADFSAGTLHLLGYFIRPEDEPLGRHLARLVADRRERNAEMLKRLNALGLTVTLAEVAAFAGENNIGRLHFAQALVARGDVASRDAAFDRYLAKGRPGYIERACLAPAEGIAMIRAAGGVAVLAHPFTLEAGREALERLVADLVAAGLQGIEVYYPQQTPRQMRQYQALAARFQLAVTGGTDFHGAPMPDIRLGVGFGALAVPDAVLDDLERRRDG